MTIRPQPLMRTLAAAVLSLVIGAPAALADDPVTLTMYNGQHKEIGEAIAKAYEAKTGIHINIRKGSSNQLASQIIEEGARSPADIIYTEESPPLNNLGELGLLAKIDDATANMMPKEYVGANGTWMGITARTRIVVFNPKKIDEKDLPTTVMDFANPEWEGRVGYVPTSGAFQEQAVAILKMHGREATEEWLTGLKAFGKTYTNNMVALKAVEKGEVAAVLVNNYYWYALERERGKLDSKLYYLADGDAGNLVTISGAAVVKASKHPKEAQALLNWMASEEGQRVITQTTAEYPLHKGMVSDRGLKPFEDLRPPKISPADLGNAEEAIELEREVGLL